ncbi:MULTISPECIES: hypothetical protein [unclassified Bradyrhizobium]|uniref:hypothetical protein n=1 Tax=unclassified Bradyrhizobium TaxID=2631580 RepID=UPI0024788FE0|nr:MULTISPECIES: hypothetical protein [unclassified Bradyrhizobium]WGS20826.1 hypothetical protein MTX22_03220 [Bradyrhizobium sp. ISRA463]WGS27723.1 hypothetical protein MTX19_01080 [Bradyrhizobium sp. ISRA464]
MQDNLPSTAKPYRLTFEDAVYVWLRHWRGEYQHHIAASYNVNPGRVNEVLKERTLAALRQPNACRQSPNANPRSPAYLPGFSRLAFFGVRFFADRSFAF